MSGASVQSTKLREVCFAVCLRSGSAVKLAVTEEKNRVGTAEIGGFPGKCRAKREGTTAPAGTTAQS